MRVLITTDTVGGVWTFTQELAAGLLQHGCPVLLVSFGREPSLTQAEQCSGLQRDYPGRFRYIASDVPLEWMDENDRAFEDGARVLEHETLRFAPDVIHSNQFCYGALQSEVPRVVTAHSDVLSWASACRPEGLAETPWLTRYKKMVQAGLIACDAVVAPTAWMLDALAESFELPGDTAVIENGRSIAVEFDTPRVLRAVTAGRLWDEGKNVRLLANVQSPIPVVIAGDTRDARVPQVGSIASAEFAGELSEPELIDLLQTSAVYLCLSKYEPFGLAALEAALCGCAVVAHDLASLREVWGDGALYFKNAEELAALLEKLKSDPERLKRAREQSYARGRQFTRERMVSGYTQLFQQVLQHSARAKNVA